VLFSARRFDSMPKPKLQRKTEMTQLKTYTLVVETKVYKLI